MDRARRDAMGGCRGFTEDQVRDLVESQQPRIQQLERDRKYRMVQMACNRNLLP
jgi:hypothetical protein